MVRAISFSRATYLNDAASTVAISQKVKKVIDKSWKTLFQKITAMDAPIKEEQMISDT